MIRLVSGAVPSRTSISDVEIELTDLTQTPRYWFLNEAGTQLLQVQSTRLVLNWRKNETDEEYDEDEE